MQGVKKRGAHEGARPDHRRRPNDKLTKAATERKPKCLSPQYEKELVDPRKALSEKRVLGCEDIGGNGSIVGDIDHSSNANVLLKLRSGFVLKYILRIHTLISNGPGLSDQTYFPVLKVLVGSTHSRNLPAGRDTSWPTIPVMKTEGAGGMGQRWHSEGGALHTSVLEYLVQAGQQNGEKQAQKPPENMLRREQMNGK
jgi:hypothetical protein